METIADFVVQHVRLFCVGIVFASFFGVRGALMTWVLIRAKLPQRQVSDMPWPERVFALADVLFQFWFNAAGGFVGWIAAWFLWYVPFDDYGWKHLIVFVIAFIGVTGNLPHLSTGIREALGSLAKRIAG